MISVNQNMAGKEQRKQDLKACGELLSSRTDWKAYSILRYQSNTMVIGWENVAITSRHEELPQESDIHIRGVPSKDYRLWRNASRLKLSGHLMNVKPSRTVHPF